MLRKIFIILHNFIKSLNKNEFIEIFLMPLLITVILYVFFNNKFNDFFQFASNFNDTVISISSLLSAFGLAAVSILITSSNENVNKADETNTNRKDRNNKPVSYYRLQIYRSFFSLIVQMILLGIAIVFKFLCGIGLGVLVLFYFEVFILLVAIISQLLTIISMYYLFVKIKK